MIEFIAGISVGVLFGLVIGLYVRELLPRQQEQCPIVVNIESSAPVAQPLYHPPIIVLAGVQKQSGAQSMPAIADRRQQIIRGVGV